MTKLRFLQWNRSTRNFNGAGRDPSAVARDFLAKVFNLSITIPPVSKEQATDCISRYLFADAMNAPPPDIKGRNVAGGCRIEPAPPVVPDGTALITAVEIEKFSKLALAIGMTNPRALWRMKQAWFVLRNMVLSLGESRAAFDPWMQSMFIREAILSLPKQSRRDISEWVKLAQVAIIGVPIPESVPSDLAQLMQEDVAGIAERWEFVDIVLSPASSAAN